MSTPNQIRVDLSRNGYDILIGVGLRTSAGSRIRNWLEERNFQTKIGLVVTDENVEDPHAELVSRSLVQNGIEPVRFTLTPGEPSKCQQTISRMYDTLVEARADRHTVVVAVGGGVVGDAAGFAAASYTRGLPFVQIPTSLLAHVDSSVGGKTGINHPRGKNLIGAFHQPIGVLCDVETVATLPDRDYRSGLAEVVKYGVILDEEFFDFLETHREQISGREPQALAHVISRSCRLKADVVEEDEFERTGLRAILNYGHTFAHAFEALSGYGEILHGEAVAIGMHYASQLAERRGMIVPEVTRRQVELLRAFGLPTELPDPAAMTADAILDCMRLDKKTTAGRLKFILPERIGAVRVFDDVTDETVREVCDSFRN